MKDIYTALPSDNCLVEIKPIGKRTAEALENGVAGIGGENGWFPPISFKLDFSFVPPPMETF